MIGAYRADTSMISAYWAGTTHQHARACARARARALTLSGSLTDTGVHTHNRTCTTTCAPATPLARACQTKCLCTTRWGWSCFD